MLDEQLEISVSTETSWKETVDVMRKLMNAGQGTEASERAYRSNKLLMTHGPTTYLEVLTAQQAYLTAQLQQTANKFNEIQGVINIYHALGGGQ